MHDSKFFSSLLAPEVGLVSSYDLVAINTAPTIYNLIIDVGQRLGSEHFGIDDRVGAWDVTMTGVLSRGIGEAVERFALRPRLEADPILGKTFSDTASELPRITKALRLPSPMPDTRYLQAYRVRRQDGQPFADRVLIDADWVNLPTSRPAQQKRWFGTPSGTAAHIGLASAIDSSLRELIERDAVTRAWNGLSQIEHVEAVDVHCKSARKLRQLQRNHPLQIYRVKSSIGSAWTFVAWAVKETQATAGSSLKACPACAGLHASIEALQVGALLREMRDNATKADVVTTNFKDTNCAEVSTFADLSTRRMTFWASAEGVSAWKDWHASSRSRSIQSTHNKTILTSEDIAAVGATHVWVDLSPRLPKPVIDKGFRVVKSFIPELFSLPMSEGEPWNCVPDGNPFAQWEPLL